MAALTWFMANAADSGGWQQLSIAAQSAVDSNAGWIVGTGSTLNSELQADSQRASSTFTGSTVPDGSLDTSLKDALRSPTVLNGSFASANWSLQFAVVSPTNGGAADGAMVVRLIKADADGSNATQITVAQQTAGTVTNVASSPDSNSSLTFNPGAFSISNQFLFIQLAWKRTGAGGMTTTNIRLRTGSAATPTGTVIVTASFTAAVTGSFISSGSTLFAPTVRYRVVGGTRATAVALFAPRLAYRVDVSQTVNDGFNRPDGATGTNWDDGYTTFDSLNLVGGRVRASTLGVDAFETWNGVVGSVDQWAEITIPTLQGAVSVGVRVLLRASAPPTASWYEFLAARNVGLFTSRIERYDSGTEVDLSAENVTAWAAGDILRAEISGSTLRLYRNGSLLLTATDTTYTSGRVGAGAFVSSVSLANAELDNFRAGPMLPVATSTQLFSPTVSHGAAGAQAATTGTRASAVTLFAPTLKYTVVGGTRSTSVSLFAPTLRYRVVGGTRASTLTLFAPTVTRGPVTVVNGTRASTLALFAPTLRYQVAAASVASTTTLFVPVTRYQVAGGTRATAATLFAPSLRYRVVVGTRTSAVALFAPTLRYLVAGGTRTTAVAVFAPTLRYRVVAGTRSAALQLFAPTVSANAAVQNVTNGTVAAGLTLFAPTLAYRVAAGTVSVTATLFAPTMRYRVVLGSAASTLTLFAPTMRYRVVTGARGSAVALFAPSVAATGSLSGGTVSTTTVFAPSTRYQIVSAFRASGLTLLSPSVKYRVAAGTRPSALVLSAPTVSVGGVSITGGTRNSTVTLFSPVLAYAVRGAVRGSTLALFAPSTSYRVVGTSIQETTLHAPSVQSFFQGVAVEFRSSTLILYAPMLHQRAHAAREGTPTFEDRYARPVFENRYAVPARETRVGIA